MLQAESPYKGGTFKLKMVFPSDYPFKAPTVSTQSCCFLATEREEVTFTTKIYHPGVNEEGAICVALLRSEEASQAALVCHCG